MKAPFKIIGFIVSFTLSSHAFGGNITDVANKLLSKSPDASFHEAVKRKDYRLLSVPFCGGNTPGFNFREYQGKELEPNNDLGLTCEALLGESEIQSLYRLEAWVEEYNNLMFGFLNNAK